MASPSLLSRLGIPGELPLVSLGSAPWALSDAAVESLDALLAQGQHAPDRFDPLPFSDELSGGLSLSRSRFVPSLLRVEGPTITHASVLGDARRVGAEALLFSAVEGSALRVGATLVTVESGALSIESLPVAEVEAQELGPSLLSSLAALPEVLLWVSPAQPSIERAFAPLTIAPWLLAEAAELRDRPGARSTVAAVGLVARLHEPADEDPAAMLEAVLSGRAAIPSVNDKALAFWRSETAADRDAVVKDSLAECDRLRASLSELSLAVESDHPAARAIARRWVRARDDLECVRFVLALDAADAALSSALDALDLDASALATLFSALGPFADSPRLSAVSWQQPHLWWSGLAV